MTAFLQLNDRLEARMLAANAVRLAFFERFGRFPSPDDRLWQLDPFVRLELVGDIELKLGVAFHEAELEFLEHPYDLIDFGASLLMGNRRTCIPTYAQYRQSMEACDGAQDHHR
jgi:hypothetical protein